MIALSILVFTVNAVRTQMQNRPLETNDPWDARTLEWMTSSPPPVHNFDEIPIVHSLDEFWHRKYAEDKSGRLVPEQEGAAEHGEPGEARGPSHAIHLPSPSYWPIIAALGLPIMAYGVIYSWWMVGLGAAVTLIGVYGWALEPSVAE